MADDRALQELHEFYLTVCCSLEGLYQGSKRANHEFLTFFRAFLSWLCKGSKP